MCGDAEPSRATFENARPLGTYPFFQPMKVSIILPSYNEAPNILQIIAAVQAHIPSSWEHEIIVVDDDSPDGTADLAAAVAQRDARVRVIRRHEQGLTGALQRGVDEARGDVVLWMDCDFSMPPATIPRLLAEIERGADIAIGSRYVPGGKDAREDWVLILFSRVLNLIAKVLIGGPVRDYTASFVAAPKPVLAQLRLRGVQGEYCIDLLTRAMRKKLRIAEIGYFCVPRVAGESKTAPSFPRYLMRGWPYLTTIFRLMLKRSP